MNIENNIENNMQYKVFANILNQHIFLKNKSDLIRKISKYPERYVGLFRPTKPQGKIIQNLTQSAEIKFGDAFEDIIELYFNDSKYKTLEKIFKKEGRKSYHLDQLFEFNNKIIFIEQKVRDDHDSTKKRGQIDNFTRKIEILQDKYQNKVIEANFYFVDDSLHKNKKYYKEEIASISEDYGIDCFLFYGKKLFDKYKIYKWDEVLEYLKQWKKSIPDIPEINFDIDVENNLKEIIKLETNVFRKIFNNEEVFTEMLLTISPEKKLLLGLLDFFKQEYKLTNKKIYDTLHKTLKDKI